MCPVRFVTYVSGRSPLEIAEGQSAQKAAVCHRPLSQLVAFAAGSKGSFMYLQRRNGHYWFRKATPLDLVHVLGQAEIRCSLRTTRRDVAKRRAGQLLVALENVFAVLRSERPLGPTKVMAELARDALQKGSSLEINPLAWRLQKAVDALGSASVPPPADGTKTLVAIGDIDALLVRERPHAEANRIAAELLGLALRIRRGNNWVRSEPARMLVEACLCEDAVGP